MPNPDPYTAPLIARYTCGHLRDLRAHRSLAEMPADALLSEQDWPCPSCQDPERPLLHSEALAGSRTKRPHPCSKCGTMIRGPRSRCTACWEGLSEEERERITQWAMAGSEIPVAAALIGPPPAEPVKRLPPRPYDEQPPVSGPLP